MQQTHTDRSGTLFNKTAATFLWLISSPTQSAFDAETLLS